jgi:hypothetical protein
MNLRACFDAATRNDVNKRDGVRKACLCCLAVLEGNGSPGEKKRMSAMIDRSVDDGDDNGRSLKLA